MPLVPRHLGPKYLCQGACNTKPFGGKPCSSASSKRNTVFEVCTQARLNPAQHRSWSTTLLLVLCFLLATNSPAAGVRVRDVAMVSGARDNQLVGYGLVAGLAGQGDKDPVYTQQTIANLLRRYGINVPPTTLSAKN